MYKYVITLSLLCFMYGVKAQPKSDPLYVIDGKIEKHFNVTPSLISHIEVIRDDSAVLIYGRKGVNGAIVITTKKDTAKARRNEGNDEIPPPKSTPFEQIVFLMQQNQELSERLDRLESRGDSLRHELNLKDSLYKFDIQIDNYLRWTMKKEIDSLEHRPVIYIDNLQKELWVKWPDGRGDIFIRKL